MYRFEQGVQKVSEQNPQVTDFLQVSKQILHSILLCLITLQYAYDTLTIRVTTPSQLY